MKKILLILTVGLLTACNALVPTPTTTPTATLTPLPSYTPSPTMTETPSSTPTITPTLTFTPHPNGFTQIRIWPSDGEFMDVLTQEVKKAMDLGQIPVIEFDATW